MTLSAFLALGDARIWIYWKYFFDIHVNFLGPVSCFSPSRDPLRVHLQGWLLWLYGHNILSLLKWKATFFVFFLPTFLLSLLSSLPPFLTSIQKLQWVGSKKYLNRISQSCLWSSILVILKFYLLLNHM